MWLCRKAILQGHEQCFAVERGIYKPKFSTFSTSSTFSLWNSWRRAWRSVLNHSNVQVITVRWEAIAFTRVWCQCTFRLTATVTGSVTQAQAVGLDVNNRAQGRLSSTSLSFFERQRQHISMTECQCRVLTGVRCEIVKFWLSYLYVIQLKTNSECHHHCKWL